MWIFWNYDFLQAYTLLCIKEITNKNLLYSTEGKKGMVLFVGPILSKLKTAFQYTLCINNHCSTPLIQDTETRKIHRVRKYIHSCQGLGDEGVGRGSGELVFNRNGVLV